MVAIKQKQAEEEEKRYSSRRRTKKEETALALRPWQTPRAQQPQALGLGEPDNPTPAHPLLQYTSNSGGEPISPHVNYNRSVRMLLVIENFAQLGLDPGRLKNHPSRGDLILVALVAPVVEDHPERAAP